MKWEGTEAGMFQAFPGEYDELIAARLSASDKWGITIFIHVPSCPEITLEVPYMYKTAGDAMVAAERFYGKILEAL